MEKYRILLNDKHVAVIKKAIGLFIDLASKKYSSLLDVFFGNSLSPVVREEAEKKFEEIKKASNLDHGNCYTLYKSRIEENVKVANEIEINVGYVVLSKRQTEVLIKLLELFSRLGMGQYRFLLEVFFAHLANPDFFNVAEYNIDVIKSMVLNLQGGYFGITSKETPEDAKVSYEIEKILLYTKSWHENPKGGYTVNFDYPLKVSNEPIPEVTVIKEKHD